MYHPGMGHQNTGEQGRPTQERGRFGALFISPLCLTTASRVSHTAFSGTSTWHRDPGNLQGTGTEDQTQALQLQDVSSN